MEAILRFHFLGSNISGGQIFGGRNLLGVKPKFGVNNLVGSTNFGGQILLGVHNLNMNTIQYICAVCEHGCKLGHKHRCNHLCMHGCK